MLPLLEGFARGGLRRFGPFQHGLGVYAFWSVLPVPLQQLLLLLASFQNDPSSRRDCVADFGESFYAGRAMRSEPRKIDDETELYTAALRALTRRAHSTFELRTYLERRSLEPAMVRHVMARLKQEKLIDDARYALDFARVRASGRRQGGRRIAQELRKRGVPDQHINAAIAQVFADLDEGAMVRKAIERRTRSRGPLDARKTASLYRTLLRAGFDPSVIRRELRAAPVPEAVEDLPG
jgi:regulatory protein